MPKFQSDNFTIARLILAAMVVFSHSYGMLGLHEPNIFFRSMGNFAVHGFFAISGYLIVGSFENAGAGGFVLRRALRIVPGYVVSMIIATFVARYFHQYSDNPIPHIVNGVLWTVNWEVVMYVVVFLLGVLGMLRSEIVGSGIVTGMLLIAVHIDSTSTALTVIAPFAMMFAIGAFIRLSRMDVQWVGWGSAFLLVFLFQGETWRMVIPALQSIQFTFGWDTNLHQLRYFLYLILTPFAIIAICKHAPFSLPLKADYSYGLYIFAWPSQQSVIAYCIAHGIALTPLMLFGIAGTIAMFAAILSWHIIESPALRLKHARLPRWRRQPKASAVPAE